MQSLNHIQNSFIKLKNEAVDRFDIFGQLPNFTILNKNKFTSTFGFFVSILLEITLLIYLANEVSSMLSYSKPSIYQTEIQVTETNPYYLFNENFTIAISLGNRFSEPLIGQKKYFFLNVSQCLRTRVKNSQSGNITVQLNCTDLPIEPCNMTHFTTDAQKNYFSRSRFGAMQCINRDFLRNNPPLLQGQFNSLMYGYLSISLSICKNTSNFNECAPQEEINEAMQAGHYIAYYSDYLQKLERPGEVYEQIINYQFSGFSLSTSKLITQTYRIIETQTDEGLIWEENKIQQNLQFKDFKEVSDFYNQQYLVNHFILLDYKQTNNIRTYIKIQTVIARIGGVLQILVLLFTLLLKPLINNFMNLEIANSIYNLQDTQNNQQQCQPAQVQFFQTEREQQSSPMQLSGVQFSQQISENFSKNPVQKLSFFEEIFIVLGINKEKYKKFQKAKKKIQKNLDILTILRKLQDIDLIKKLIFTKDQLETFKILSKPSISLDKSLKKFPKTKHFQEITTNVSPLPLQLRKARQLQSSQNVNLALSKSFIDEQLQIYLQQHNIQNNYKNCINQKVNQEPDLILSEICESPAQQPK